MHSMQNLFYFILSIIISFIVIFFTALNKKKKIIVFELIIAIPIITFLWFYFWNEDFNINVRSSYFSNSICKITANGINNTSIKLPNGSVLLFKTPMSVYYSKDNVEQCKNFFNSELEKMKQSGEILGYRYLLEEKTFYVDIKEKSSLKIQLIGDGDLRRYGIISQ